MEDDPSHDRTVANTAHGISVSPAVATPWVADKPRFLLFGDSLTERGFQPSGWISGLAHHYMRRVDMVSRGFGGYNTRWALRIADNILQGTDANNTLLVTIWLGANDAARLDGPPHSARQHVPVAEYRENLKQLVATVRAKGVSNMILLGPPPVWDEGRKRWQVQKLGAQHAASLPLDRSLETTKPYALAACEVASELHVPCVELFRSMQATKGWGEALLCDGLHFTALGEQLVLQRLLEVLQAHYPSLSPEMLPLHHPAWDQLEEQVQAVGTM